MSTKEAKPTPGPWRQGSLRGYNACTIFADADSESIATVYGIPIHTQVGDVSERYAEGMANARLIAASPDLLEALKGLLSACDEEGSFENFSFDHPHYKPRFDAARAAIRKASGEQS